jgi:hypothetical protein
MERIELRDLCVVAGMICFQGTPVVGPEHSGELFISQRIGSVRYRLVIKGQQVWAEVIYESYKHITYGDIQHTLPKRITMHVIGEQYVSEEEEIYTDTDSVMSYSEDDDVMIYFSE